MSRDCMCAFPQECNGFGTLHCEGCGGDQCVCRCGGETECPGCRNCESDDNEDRGDGVADNGP